ncbi:hypothetical protein G3I23_27405 [Streptomyces sp. SID10115]|uniref:hypothetical protein n=1 Tax=Streptomyces sp. SID339 TaxID=2706080 RepID=UPI0013B84EC4|nr:hypothetical protein [Streptomyces sp. SID339]NDZ89236.1 hypothetical protein [Streptomyces sp. SID10115]NEA06352.1 hypothetical protein [Streptomyces sp. SID10116]NEB47262.1 hypothetical protein [Streptomyces sp. SID339]
MKRTVERSAEGVGVGGVEEGDGGADAEGDARVGVDAVKAARTAASSSGRLCAAPPAPSELANCHAPSAPAAVPTATHAAVTTAFRHFLIPPLCRIVS